MIVQVKGNQKTLLHDCERITTDTKPDDVYQEPLTKGRNRIESRTASTYFYPLLSDPVKWASVMMIIKVARFCRRFDTKSQQWRESHETAFYISTIDLDAQTACHAIRQHWGIENRNHYVRDVTLGEDASRIRVNPHIFAKLRSFALNILRHNRVQNVSVELFDNCIDLQRVLNYYGVL